MTVDEMAVVKMTVDGMTCFSLQLDAARKCCDNFAKVSEEIRLRSETEETPFRDGERGTGDPIVQKDFLSGIDQVY